MFLEALSMSPGNYPENKNLAVLVFDLYKLHDVEMVIID